jgi:hypothetical protein
MGSRLHGWMGALLKMEVRVLDPYMGNFDDGLDSELDTIGIILDNPVICGKCMKPMTKVDATLFSCPTCDAIFKIKG